MGASVRVRDGVRRGTRQSRWVAVAVVAGLALAGCAGGEPAEDATTETAAPAPTTRVATPSPSFDPTPEPPPELTEPPVTVPGVDPEGARQAAVEFMEAIGRAWLSEDTSEIRARSEELCSYCTGQAELIETHKIQDEHITDDLQLTVIDSAGFAPRPNNEFHSALVEVSAQAADFVNSEGEVVGRAPEVWMVLLFGLRMTSEGWSVVQAVEVSPEEAERLRSERS